MIRQFFNRIQNLLRFLTTAAMIATTGLLITLPVLTGCGDEAVTECTTTTFTMDNTVRRLCELTVDTNHIVISNLSLNGGTFTIYAGTDSNGSNGGTLTFSPGASGIDLNVTYRGGSDTQTITDSTAKYWLIGFHEESPGVHIVTKSSDTEPADWETVTPDIDREPGEWEQQSLPHSGSVNYRGNGNVILDSVRLFHEEHDH